MWLWITKLPPSTRHSKTKKQLAELAELAELASSKQQPATSNQSWQPELATRAGKQQPATSNQQPEATSNQQPATRAGNQSWQAKCKSSRKSSISHRNPKLF
jgi:hypothetical protein